MEHSRMDVEYLFWILSEMVVAVEQAFGDEISRVEV
jgi:hypothetical protein